MEPGQSLGATGVAEATADELTPEGARESRRLVGEKGNAIAAWANIRNFSEGTQKKATGLRDHWSGGGFCVCGTGGDMITVHRL
jgi:hypothetical protein